jgi:alpha-amylase
MITKHKRTICLFFQVHQPYRLRVYRFFDIGVDHQYYDDARNKHILKRVVHNSYMPANDLLMNCIKKYGPGFKITFGISGSALEQFEKYTPWVIESFRKLYETGNVEFVAEPYPYSLALLFHQAEYVRQVKEHGKILSRLIGAIPQAMANTNLLYSDKIAAIAKEMNLKTILTEGANQVLGWQSPDYMYSCSPYPEIKLLLRNHQLSDDIGYRFSMRDWSEWPLTAEKYISWLNGLDKKEQIVNLFMDLSSLGEHQPSGTGIFNFYNAFLNQAISSGNWVFRTVSEASQTINPVGSLSVSEEISWADQDHNITAWLGNELQKEAFTNLYSAGPVMKHCTDKKLLKDWNNLQASDHFCYMSTKRMNDGKLRNEFSPYSSPYEAFVNYMNVISDFLMRVDEYTVRNTIAALQQNMPHPEAEAKQGEFHLVSF